MLYPIAAASESEFLPGTGLAVAGLGFRVGPLFLVT